MNIIFLLLFGIAYGSYEEYLNQFLESFETIHKDKIYLEKVLNVSTPTAMKFYLRIEVQNQIFHASLQPHLDIFHPEVHIQSTDSSGSETKSVNYHEFLEGTLLNDPKSRVVIHISDNIVTGTIFTSDGESYFIEPSHRHIKEEHDFHMISYRLSDVKFNLTQKDGGHFCGHESHANEKSFKPDDLKFRVPINDVKDEDEIQYSRKKRNTDIKNKCPLALVADHIFYKDVCSSDEANAVNFMIHLVQQVDALFKKQSLDPNSAEKYKNYGFQIKFVEVIKSPDTTSSKKDSYTYYDESYVPNVSTLLKNFAYGPWEKYCLAHLFTNYDFDGGVLGLAYVASAATSRVGGVCTKTYKDGTGQTKSLNVGLTTSTNYKRLLLSSELVYVTGHEFGHNWGSSHDSDLSAECAPNGNRFLMYPAAVDGSQPNNEKFSPCSKQAIKDVLDSKADLCFVEESTSFCGNGVVEKGEECDAGLEGSACCTKDCKFTAGSVCADANSDCCLNCKFADGSTCLETNWESPSNSICRKDYKCNSEGKCLPGDPVDNNDVCYDNGRCMDGVCLSFCTAKSLEDCSCTATADLCKQCCKNQAGTCEVFEDNGSYLNLTDGKSCPNGNCKAGVCKITSQDIQEKFWEIIDEININKILRWFKNNIVLTVIVFTSILWIPVAFFLNWLDDNYDLWILDDWLGGDDGGEKGDKDKKKLVNVQSTV